MEIRVSGGQKGVKADRCMGRAVVAIVALSVEGWGGGGGAGVACKALLGRNRGEGRVMPMGLHK